MKKFVAFFVFCFLLRFCVYAQPEKNTLPACNIKVHMNGINFTTAVSARGIVAYQSSHHEGMADTLQRGIYIRYADDSVFKINYAAACYYASSLGLADSLLSAERSIAERSIATINPNSQKLLYKPGKLVTVTAIRNYRQMPVHVMSYRSPTNRTWNVYYARISELMPTVARKKKRKDAVAMSFASLLSPDEENIIVHAEVVVDGKKQVVIELDSISRQNMPAAAFSIPENFTRSTQQTGQRASRKFLPPGPGFKRDAINQPDHTRIDVTMDKGIGPVIAHAAMYVLFWGKAFQQPGATAAVQSIALSMQDVLSPGYTAPLAFYGVFKGKVVRNIFVNDDPPASAGGGGSGAVVGAFLIGQIFDKDLPKIWWSFGDDDPLYMILVPEDQVDHGGWSGYHFVVPTYYDSFVPFPFNYLMHEELPYAFAKIPNRGLQLGSEDLLQRASICATNTPACQVLQQYDEGTENISHEYTEVCTDPTPFFSWVDAGRGTEGEIADICETSPAPFSSSSRVGLSVLSTYWSVPANACVPNATGTLVIKQPLDNTEVMWQAGGGTTTLFALATDPIAGDLEDIRWTDETGRALGTGVNIQSTGLSLGQHTIRAQAFRKTVAGASAVTHVNVVAKAPNDPLIESPLSSRSYASDELINFRGSAFDIQDGDLPDNQLSWSVDGTAIGKGKLLAAKLNTTGIKGVTLTATNSAGLSTAVAVLIKLGPATGGRASIRITAPLNGTTFFKPGDLITFTCEAILADGTPAPDNVIIWKDDLDGRLGTGRTLVHTLSGGPGGPIVHHVTATISMFTVGGTPSPSDIIIVKKGAVL